LELIIFQFYPRSTPTNHQWKRGVPQSLSILSKINGNISDNGGVIQEGSFQFYPRSTLPW